MYTIKCAVKGVTPLMTDKFDTDLDNVSDTNKNKKSKLPRDVAELGLYLNEKGKPGVPGMNLFSCLIEAGRYKKWGKVQVSTRDRSLLPGYVTLAEAFIPLKHSKPWEVDSRRIVNRNNNAAVIKHRPRFDAWQLLFNLEVDEEFDEDLLREIVDISGKRVGLGSFRPDRKGWYGKFKVIKWDVKQAA
jgi:hypothetical protein